MKHEQMQKGSDKRTPSCGASLAMLLGASLTLGACSAVKSSDFRLGKKEAKGAQTQSFNERNAKVKLSVVDEETSANLSLSLATQNEVSLALAPTSGFTFDLLGCKSGFSASDLTSNTSTETIALYQHDHDCFFDLKEFGFGGATYVPVAGTSFFNGVAFDEDRVVYFVNDADPNDRVKVRIQDFLPSPLTDGEEFTYVFMQIKQGTDYAVQNYSYTSTMEVLGVEAPNVAISSMALTAIDSSTGQATFQTTLACNVALVDDNGKDACPTATAELQRLEDFKSILISEPADPAAFDYDAARALFDDAGNNAIIQSAQSNVTATTFDMSNTQKDGPLHSNKEMYLVIQYTDPNDSENRSYRYFKVTIGDPQL